MERMVIGRTGFEVYRLGFGGIPIQRVSETQAVETVSQAVRLGVDFIDTSRVYMTSERRIGPALKQTDRKVIPASKSLSRRYDEVRCLIFNLARSAGSNTNDESGWLEHFIEYRSKHGYTQTINNTTSCQLIKQVDLP